jgi:hypothetical protein
MQDMDFHCILSDTKKEAWNALKSMCNNFLGITNLRTVEKLLVNCYSVSKL